MDLDVAGLRWAAARSLDANAARRKLVLDGYNRTEAAALCGIAAAASTGVGIGGAVGEFAGLFGTTITGVITSGAIQVFTNLQPPARAGDFVNCAWHGQMQIAQGSQIVGINGMPAARVGDMTTYLAVIAKGSGNVNIGGPTATILPISPEVPFIAEAIVVALGLLGGVGELALASAATRRLLAARMALGLTTGVGAGALGHRIGGELFGEGSVGQRKLELGAGLLGGAFGSGIGKGRLDPFNYRVTQEGLGSNLGNVRVRYIRGEGETPTATLRGQQYELPGTEYKDIDYTKRDRAEYSAMRSDFGSNVRPAWLKANTDNPQMSAAGIDDEGVSAMQNGSVPDGYQVHHIVPLDDGGTNDLSNLILTRQDTKHMLLTNNQLSQTAGMGVGSTKPVTLITPPAGAVVWPQTATQSAIPTR